MKEELLKEIEAYRHAIANVELELERYHEELDRLLTEFDKLD